MKPFETAADSQPSDQSAGTTGLTDDEFARSPLGKSVKALQEQAGATFHGFTRKPLNHQTGDRRQNVY